MLGDRGAGCDRVVAAIGQAGEDAVEAVALKLSTFSSDQLTRHRAHQLDIEAGGGSPGTSKGGSGNAAAILSTPGLEDERARQAHGPRRPPARGTLP